LYLSDSEPERFTLDNVETFIEIHGSRGELRLHRLDEATFLFRSSFRTGLTVGDAAERALDVEALFDAGLALAALIHEGLVTHLTFGVHHERVV
jgi:hypothetical protein